MAKVGSVLCGSTSKLVHGRNQDVSAIYRTVRTIVSSRLFVGGLSFETQEDCLRRAFAPHGDVEDVKVISDRETGRSKGYGFVTFTSEVDAEAALQVMDGKIVDGRTIRVDYASIPFSPRGGGFNGGKGGFRGGNTGY